MKYFFLSVERFLGNMKEMLTTHHDYLTQGVLNFLLKYHSGPMLQSADFCEEAQSCLSRNGLTNEFFTSFAVHHATYIDEDGLVNPMIPAAEQALHHFLEKETGDVEYIFKRVARLKRYNMALASVTGRNLSTRGRQDVERNDSYIMVNEGDFGEIAEIVETNADLRIYIAVMRLFKKVDLLSVDGSTVLLPMNHYPFQRTNNYKCFTLDRSVFIQKGVYCSIQYLMKTTVDDCLSFRPNDQFSM